MVETKIAEIRGRNFEKSEFRKEYNEKITKLPYEDFHNITLDFTSFKCGKVITEIRKIIKRICPDFYLNVSFTNIKLRKILSPHLKPKISRELNSNLIYKFSCPCANAEYIGETRQILEYRVQQHRRDSESNVKAHISTCSIYQDLLSQTYPNSTLTQKREFLFSHFKILEKNSTNKFTRRTFEANYINVCCPNLNKQVFITV